MLRSVGVWAIEIPRLPPVAQDDRCPAALAQHNIGRERTRQAPNVIAASQACLGLWMRLPRRTKRG